MNVDISETSHKWDYGADLVECIDPYNTGNVHCLSRDTDDCKNIRKENVFKRKNKYK